MPLSHRDFKFFGFFSVEIRSNFSKKLRFARFRNFQYFLFSIFQQIFQFLILNYSNFYYQRYKFSRTLDRFSKNKKKKKENYLREFLSLSVVSFLEERKQKNRRPLGVADADIPVSRDFGARWRSRYGKDGRLGKEHDGERRRGGAHLHAESQGWLAG